MRLKSLIAVAFLSAGFLIAQSPDNTKTNQRDRGSSLPTADQQSKSNPSDTDIVRRIRQSIVADKTLSVYAHNVKVISQNGTVTLRGPVRSETERDSLQQKAAAVAGADHVTNQLEVASK